MQYANELSTVGLDTIAQMAEEARCDIDYIYLHWTAGRYGQVFSDYHISIDYDGRIYLPYDCRNLTVYRSHTWQRNSRAIGIALCAAYGAEANNGWNCDFGSQPVTDAQIEAMSLVVATICKHAGIPLDHVLTHCEAAVEDDYGPGSGDPETRWDLWFLKDYDGQMKPGGNVIRGKAQWYLLNTKL